MNAASSGAKTPEEYPSVTISVRSRFHAFDLARQLHGRQALRRLITSYPRFKALEWGIPGDRVTSLLRFGIASRVTSRLRLSPSFRIQAEIQMAFAFDRAAARHIPEGTEIFVGWSGSARESMRRARSLGARTVVERGSSHIGFQNEILRKAYADAGLDWPGMPLVCIAAEEREYEEADFISVPTRFARDTFTERGVDPRRVLVVPYGCDLSVFHPGNKRDRIFRIIHCGQISVRKGVHILAQAFAELNLPGAELWLIGGMTPEAEQILARYRSAAISVKGPFPRNALPEYYAQGSVFCIASYEEGLAQVILQAMSCGLPVIATVNSGASDVIAEGRTGFVIPAGDVDALKERISRLFEDSALREEMAANLRESGRPDLSWDSYGARMAGAYRSMAAGQNFQED